MGRVRSLYGASPLHLLAHLIARQPTLVRLAWICDVAMP